MRDITFYAEMPDSWASKAACKSHVAFTRFTLNHWAATGKHNNCLAVWGKPYLTQGPIPVNECLSAVLYTSNSDVNVGAVSREHLQKRCVRISEELARKLHPKLAARLDAAD
jgi:hypothetical protein